MTYRDALPDRPSLWRHALFALLLAGVVGSIFVLWRLAAATCPDCLSLQGWRALHDLFLGFVRSNPFAATAVLFVLHVLLAMLALPGASLLMLVAGAGFGPLAGTLLCVTACTAGASLSMLVVRHFLQPVVRRKMGKRLAGLERRVASDGAACLFSLRLLPVIPFALVNVVAGLSGMKAWTFAWISFVSMFAGTFAYVNAGSQLAEIETAGDIYTARVLLSFAALALLPWLVKLAHGAWERRARAGA